MKKYFVLDACALLAVINNETGADSINSLIREAVYDSDTILKMNQINLFEVYYGVINYYDQNTADEMLTQIAVLPIKIIVGLNNNTLKEAGRIKSTYRIPIGDSIAAAECVTGNGILVTSDHNDFERVVQAEKIKTLWFR